MSFMEGKRTKAVEGIPVPEAEILQEVTKDVEKGEMEKEEKKEEKEGEKGKGRDDNVVR